MGKPRDGTAREMRARTQAHKPHRELLAHVGRVALLGQLSGAFAHELAQPLTSILANAKAALGIAMRDPAVPVELQELLRAIVRDDLRAVDTIQRLRSLLARGQSQRRLVDLNQIIREALSLMRGDFIVRDIALTMQLAPQAAVVLADRVQMQQVLLNLIVNACDAMAETPATERRLTISTQIIDARIVECSVIDHGHGIPAHDMERIFEPFVTTKAHGLGLGLVICRSIIKAHGGRLWAESSGDAGATFHFTVSSGVRGRHTRKPASGKRNLSLVRRREPRGTQELEVA